MFEFSTRGAETRRIEDLRVALHGRGFPRREVRRTTRQTIRSRSPGFFNIGVLHTACGRAGHANYAPCTPADLAARGYDYWALGHVHAYEIVSRDPWIVYPGNLQGRSVRECGEKGAVIVSVEDGRVASVRRAIVDGARWAEVGVDAGLARTSPSWCAIEAQVRPHADAAEGRMLAVRVRLEGNAPARRFAADFDLRDKAEAAAQRCGDSVWLERLRLPRAPSSAWAARLPSWISPQVSARARRIGRCAPRSRSCWGSIPRGFRAGSPTQEMKDALDLDGVLAEARALALGRAEAG